MATEEERHVAIRAATLDDAGDIERIRVAGWRAAYPGLMPQSYLDAMRLDDEAIAARRRRMDQNPPDVRSLVSEDDAGVTGFVVYGPDRDGHQASGRTAGEVFALYVAPRAWSRGHGRALLARAVRALSTAGYPEAGLWVLEGNTRARAFYERFGLTPTGQTQLFEIGDVGVPEVRYAIRLAGALG